MPDVRCLEVVAGKAADSFFVTMDAVGCCTLRDVVDDDATEAGDGDQLLGVVVGVGAGAGAGVD